MNEIDTREQVIEWIPFDRLLLDDENPRLPEGLHGASQSEILRFLLEQGALEELAQSYLDNGFFQHEPLIVVLEHGKKRRKQRGKDRYTVVEGNRRLAALKILHESPEADDAGFFGIHPSSAQLDTLVEIPCFLIPDRDQIHAYIGFRHIGGLKTWPPEAKARYLLAEVHRLVGEGFDNPFRELGRRVGSNAQGVRNPYLAIRILLYAREEFGLNVAYVQEHRFGVWLRCMNSADIRRYVGINKARSYQEIEQALEEIDRDKLTEVLGDLESTRGQSRAVLGDSRDVTDYGRVLMDKRARKVLRSSADLSLARQVIEELDLEPRARRLAKSVGLFLETLHRAEAAEISGSLVQAVEELSRLARSARAVVRDRMDDRDHDS
ncbi:MAG: ParB N-terminal domain-containing protein [Chromatiales bacterium]|nr:ParB N-terminal domain-containing protein [Chromatiales bacterium]